MEKKVFVAGENCFIRQETLSDESIVYNVILHCESKAIVALNCANFNHALALHTDIEVCVSIDVDVPVISHEAQKKIDALREEKVQIERTATMLKSGNERLHNSLHFSRKATHGLMEKIESCREQIAQADDVNDSLRAKNKNLKRGIKELSDRYQESQHQEIKLGLELETLKSRIRNLAVDKEDL